MRGDTIVAIATPLGMGGVGIIRLSGPQSREVVSSLLGRMRWRHAQMKWVRFRHSKQGVMDTGYVVWFKAPRSFTGEDVVELHLHGGPHILQQMVMVLCQQGARLAVRGEFTKRAFLNGKMDLSQAEAIIDMIEARSEVAHSVAMGHHQGKLFAYIQSVRGGLMRILEQIEASIDFPDEVEGIDPVETRQVLQGFHADLNRLAQVGDWGKWVHGGIQCVLVGKPNVGKSALLNALTGESRAIVSDIPGTTRDYISVTTQLHGFLVEWTDTAGLRDTTHVIEQAGINRSKEQLAQADIILLVLDQSEALTREDREVIGVIHPDKKGLIVWNKQDLKGGALPTLDLKWPVVSISAKTGEGVLAVMEHIHRLIQTTIEGESMDVLCNTRQMVAMGGLVEMVGQVNDDILVIDLRRALLKLGEITGDSLTEEVLDGIFSRFCIGK